MYMAKRKPNEADETAPIEPQDALPANEPPASSESQSEEGQKKRKWAPQFNNFGDYEAGVRVIEDRPNKRMTIQFAEKPSAEVLAVMKSKEYGYSYDIEDKLWYKRINPAKPRQSRAEADELFLKVDNMVREEKGLPPREVSGPSM
jgi:hypothetical protein